MSASLLDPSPVRIHLGTKTNAKVLCPLVNVPMIDYTLEFLARNDVKEVFVFCVSHAKQLEEYLQSSAWQEQMEVSADVKTSAPPKVVFYVIDTA